VAATRFDTDTAVTPLGEGRYRARLDAGWWVEAGPNGGYLGAVLVRAMQDAVADGARTARSVTVHHLAPPVVGLAEVEVRIERAGRSLSSVSARMSQGDRPVALALGAFARDRRGPSFVDAVRPEVPGPDACEPGPFEPGELPVPALAGRFEHRWAAGPRPLSGGDVAESTGWIRLAERRPIDAALLVTYVDAWMPVLFGRVRGPWGITTVDLTVHVRHAPVEPPDGWCLVRFRSDASVDGFCEETGEVWAPDGTLLAQSRQLAALVELRRPASAPPQPGRV